MVSPADIANAQSRISRLVQILTVAQETGFIEDTRTGKSVLLASTRGQRMMRYYQKRLKQSRRTLVLGCNGVLGQ